MDMHSGKFINLIVWTFSYASSKSNICERCIIISAYLNLDEMLILIQ